MTILHVLLIGLALFALGCTVAGLACAIMSSRIRRAYGPEDGE